MPERKSIFLFAVHLYFLVMITLTVIFAQDRLCRDPSYFLLQIMNHHNFVVEHYRYTTVITQALAVLGVWLQVPLKWVITLYSVSDYLFYYAVFILLAYWLKNLKYLFIYLLCMVIGTTHLFFLPGMVLFIGIALLMLFFSILEYSHPSGYLQWLALLLLETLALISYPTLFIPLIFMLALNVVLNTVPLRTALYLMSAALLILALKSLLKDPYDAAIINYVFSRQHLQIIRAAITREWAAIFCKDYLITFWPVIVMLISAIIINIRKRRLSLLSGSLSCIISIFAFLVFTNPYHGLDSYFEKLQYMLVPMISAWFIFSIFPDKKMINFIQPAIVLFMLCNVCSVIEARHNYHVRFNKICNIIKGARETGGRKFTLATYSTPTVYDIDDWSLSIETMLYSSLSSADSTITIFRLSDTTTLKQKPNEVGMNEYIFSTNSVYPYSQLNNHYFHLPPCKYLPLNTFGNEDFSQYNFPTMNENRLPLISIRPIDPKLHADDCNQVEMVIHNADKGKVFGSLSENGRVYFTYHFNKDSVQQEYKTPLDMDVINDYRQVVYIKAPFAKGKYDLEIDLTTDDRKTPIAISFVKCEVK